MLDEQQHVVIHVTSDARTRHAPLQVKNVAVRLTSKIDDKEAAHYAWIIIPIESSAASATASARVG